jgi:hypothetical protein
VGQRCRICDHARRSDIDIAIARGVPVPAVARQFSVSPHSLKRHKEHGHIPASIRDAFSQTAAQLSIEALTQLRAEEAQGVLLNLARERSVLFKLQDECIRKGWRPLALAASDKLHRNIELTARALGTFAEHEQAVAKVANFQILLQPAYVDLRSNLIAALRPYGKAREAVGEVLAQLEGEVPHFTGKHPRQIEVSADG